MRWPSKNPDDYVTRPTWGDADPASPPVRFAVTILVIVVASFGALVVTTDRVALLWAGGGLVPGTVQAAWWIRRRMRRANPT